MTLESEKSEDDAYVYPIRKYIASIVVFLMAVGVSAWCYQTILGRDNGARSNYLILEGVGFAIFAAAYLFYKSYKILRIKKYSDIEYQGLWQPSDRALLKKVILWIAGIVLVPTVLLGGLYLYLKP